MVKAKKDRQKKKKSFRRVPTRPVIENSKKIQKKYETPLGLLSEPKHVRKGRERENKNNHFNQFLARPVIENCKNIAKKFKKLKNTISASFQAKPGWKRQRKREKKNYSSVPFRSYPTG